MPSKISKRVKKFLVGVATTLVLVFSVIFFGNIQDSQMASSWGAAEFLEYFFYDIFFKQSTSTVQDDGLATHFDPNILIVDIDEASLSKMGNYNEWDRSIHANVVKNLTEGGASAIGFDILFKNADFGKQKTQQTLQILNEISPNNSWDSLTSNLISHYNYDSVLVHAVAESENTIVCAIFDDNKSYKHETQWRSLSSKNRADEIGYSSTFNISQVDSAANIEAKDLLDNLFPELAQAGAKMGSVNAYPDEDGILRHVSMLYRFPNPALYPDVEPKIYSTLSLMTILHVFHQKPENVKIKMGKYIDVGKPFGIFRDEKGNFNATYPHFSYPMFLALKAKLTANKNKPQEGFIDVASKIIATKNEEGNITFEIFEGQILNENLSQILRTMNVGQFSALDSEVNLSETITLKKDEEEDRFILTDLEEEEEAVITPYIVSAIQFFKDSLDNLEENHPTHLSLDLDISYDKKTRRWNSNFSVLNHDVLIDILKTPLDSVMLLKTNEEFRFGKAKRIPIDRYGRFQVNYQGRYNLEEKHRPFQHLSYYDVTKNRIDPGFYQGKIFILGSAAPALFDFVPGPHEENLPAVLIHATIIKNILNDSYMVNLSESYQQIIVILLALICLLTGLYFRHYFSIICTFIIFVAYTLIAYYYFINGLYIGMSKQIFIIFLTNIAALIVQFYFESREKRFLGNAFKQYISPELIDEMVNNEIMPTLGGVKSNISAYFTDIAGFSTFSEQIGDPSRLVELLNEYLTAMTDTLLHNKGTLDKYEGDAIIAFFGAPMPLPNHAQNACETAVNMQMKLRELRKKWEKEGDKWPRIVHEMHMRIGINSGDIVTGNMGSTMRKNYTMMGDAVNLAARLESIAKQYGAYIHISEDTERLITKSKFIYRALDKIRVVGKMQPVQTYEILDLAENKNNENLKQLTTLWNEAREAYLNMEWSRAIELFTACLAFEPHHPEKDPGSKTTPSHVFINRCLEYQKNPPVKAGEVWDGVFVATNK